ncbi:MAG: hypothetical protein O3A00_23440 [Planctomycetota bacterium]|nr:hypothetical protein [Planctomycetota bacterium]
MMHGLILILLLTTPVIAVFTGVATGVSVAFSPDEDGQHAAPAKF